MLEIADDGAAVARGSVTDVWQQGDASTGEDDRLLAAADVPEAAITRITAPEAPQEYHRSLIEASTRAGLSPDLLAAVVWRESRWRSGAVSPKGALGLAQLMPATARALAVDPLDAAANLAGGARYLRQMLDQFDGDVERALAAYNAGPARVRRAGGVPAIAETRAYVAAVMSRLGGAVPPQSRGAQP